MLRTVAKATFALARRPQHNLLVKTRPMMAAATFRPFSDNNIKMDKFDIKRGQTEEQVQASSTTPNLEHSEKMAFKAETKKLLNIVAKSIYTDKEIFLRELLSNCSDALEKQRYAEISGKSDSANILDFKISIETNDKDRTLTLYDSGIGMDRDQIMTNLGTIAKSGS